MDALNRKTCYSELIICILQLWHICRIGFFWGMDMESSGSWYVSHGSLCITVIQRWIPIYSGDFRCHGGIFSLSQWLNHLLCSRVPLVKRLVADPWRTECCPQRRLLIDVYWRSPISSNPAYERSPNPIARNSLDISQSAGTKFFQSTWARCMSWVKTRQWGGWNLVERLNLNVESCKLQLLWHPDCCGKPHPAKRDIAACIDWNLRKPGPWQIQ